MPSFPDVSSAPAPSHRRPSPPRARDDLAPSQLVLPLFVRFGQRGAHAGFVDAGVVQTSVDELLRDARAAAEAGIGGVLLFGIPEHKDDEGSSAWDDQGPVQQAVRALKRELPQLVVITDVCMCEYTDHGHCGVLRERRASTTIATLELLAREALSHARAGADIVAPSDMMDGRVGAIRARARRRGLRDRRRSSATPPSTRARSTARSARPRRARRRAGDRRGYQMDAANADEALREARLDIEEGADMVMVKPAGPYLDIIPRVKAETGYPLAAYQVSGEYAMIQGGGRARLDRRERAMMESLIGIRRAGADIIITYFAREAAPTC